MADPSSPIDALRERTNPEGGGHICDGGWHAREYGCEPVYRLSPGCPCEAIGPHRGGEGSCECDCHPSPGKETE